MEANQENSQKSGKITFAAYNLLISRRGDNVKNAFVGIGEIQLIARYILDIRVKVGVVVKISADLRVFLKLLICFFQQLLILRVVLVYLYLIVYDYVNDGYRNLFHFLCR